MDNSKMNWEILGVGAVRCNVPSQNLLLKSVNQRIS